MAIPPAPLSSLVDDIDIAIIAEVQAVRDNDQQSWREQPWAQNAPASTQRPSQGVGRGPIGAAPALNSQRCRLIVQKVIKGQAEAMIEVEKPKSHYVLAPGHKGPFLLAKSKNGLIILGRYGPDSYTLAEVEAVLAQRK